MIALLASFSESYPAVSASVTRARHDIGVFMNDHGATLQQLEAVRAAVSEAVSNAVLHAYRGPPGQVHVTANVTGGDLWVLVTDEGRGFQAETDAPGLGWGLALIAQAADDFVLAERAQGGTEARMRFSLGPVAERCAG